MTQEVDTMAIALTLQAAEIEFVAHGSILFGFFG